MKGLSFQGFFSSNNAFGGGARFGRDNSVIFSVSRMFGLANHCLTLFVELIFSAYLVCSISKCCFLLYSMRRGSE